MPERSIKKRAFSSPPAKNGSTSLSAKTPLGVELPEPSLEHLERLTDDTGLYQHAKFIMPDRQEGYSTDDNARAEIVMTKYYAHHPQPEALRLFDTYLSFMLHAQKEDGSIRNFMNFNRSWRRNEPGNDALGRILWACGTVLATPPLPLYLPVVENCFDKSIAHLQRQRLRGLAYSILGMSGYLKRFPDADGIKQQMGTAADQLLAHYEKNSLPNWQWFESVLTYDNAVLPHALFAAGIVLANNKYIEAAQKTCEFLLANTFTGSHFSFIGCHKWYERGKAKASFDQQPIQAASTIMMLKAAYDATQDRKFQMLQRKAFDWFLGANDLGIALYDFATKGCSDGLTPDEANVNQGAESILSFLLALFAMLED